MNYRKLLIQALIVINIWVFAFLIIRKHTQKYQYDCIENPKSEYAKDVEESEAMLSLYTPNRIDYFNLTGFEHIREVLKKFQRHVQETDIDQVILNETSKQLYYNLDISKSEYQFFLDNKVTHVILKNDGTLLLEIPSNSCLVQKQLIIYTPNIHQDISTILKDENFLPSDIVPVNKPYWFEVSYMMTDPLFK